MSLADKTKLQVAFGETWKSTIIPNGLSLDGTGDYVSSPDHADHDIVGDIELRARMTPSDNTPAADMEIGSKWESTSDERSWSWHINAGGILEWEHTTDGTVGTLYTKTATSAPGYTDGVTWHAAVTVDVSTGTVTHYWHADPHSPPAALADWDNSDAIAGAATSIYASTAELEVGMRDTDTNPFTGIIHDLLVYDGMVADSGTLTASPRFSDVAQYAIGQTSATTSDDQNDYTWTLVADAVISGSWVDVSDKLQAHRSVRGRQHETGVYEAGTAQYVLLNNSREFEPEYASGAYYPDVLPWVPVRESVTYDGWSQIRWQGYVEGWRPHYFQAGKASTCRLRCTDAFRMFNRLQITQYENEVQRDSPLSWWKLQETTGTTATDSGSAGDDGTYTTTGGNAAALDAPAGGSGPTLVFAVGADTDRGLVVCVTQEGSAPKPSAPTVDYGGEAMAEVADLTDGTNQNNRMTLFYLGETGIAAAGTTTITVTGGVTDTYIMAGSYTDVALNPTTTTDEATAGSAPNPITTVAVTPPSEGTMVIAFGTASVGAGTAAWANLTEALDTAADNHNQTWAQDTSADLVEVNPQCTWSEGSPARQIIMAIVVEGTSVLPVLAQAGPLAAGTTYGVEFDDDHHNVVTVGAITGSDVGTDFTLEFWFKLGGHDISLPEQTIVQIDEVNGQSMFGAIVTHVDHPADRLGWQVPTDGAGGVQTAFMPDLDLDDLTWYHVALQCDYSEKTITPFVNAVQYGDLSMDQWDQTQTVGTMTVDIADGDSHNHYHGYLAQIAIHVGLLDRGRIQAHYAAKYGPFPAEPYQTRIASILT